MDVCVHALTQVGYVREPLVVYTRCLRCVYTHRTGCTQEGCAVTSVYSGKHMDQQRPGGLDLLQQRARGGAAAHGPAVWPGGLAQLSGQLHALRPPRHTPDLRSSYTECARGVQPVHAPRLVYTLKSHVCTHSVGVRIHTGRDVYTECPTCTHQSWGRRTQSALVVYSLYTHHARCICYA